MAVELNHTIVRCTDKRGVGAVPRGHPGAGAPTTYGPFVVVQVANGVSMDYADDHGQPHPQHYAFMVGEDEFDQIQARHRRARPDLLGRPGPPFRGRDQHQRRRTRPLLGGPGRPHPRDHHRPVRRWLKWSSGAFSVSLAVKDIAASRAFYEKLGFAVFGGDQSRTG